MLVELVLSDKNVLVVGGGDDAYSIISQTEAAVTLVAPRSSVSARLVDLHSTGDFGWFGSHDLACRRLGSIGEVEGGKGHRRFALLLKSAILNSMGSKDVSFHR